MRVKSKLRQTARQNQRDRSKKSWPCRNEGERIYFCSCTYAATTVKPLAPTVKDPIDYPPSKPGHSSNEPMYRRLCTTYRMTSLPVRLRDLRSSNQTRRNSARIDVVRHTTRISTGDLAQCIYDLSSAFVATHPQPLAPQLYRLVQVSVRFHGIQIDK